MCAKPVYAKLRLCVCPLVFVWLSACASSVSVLPGEAQGAAPLQTSSVQSGDSQGQSGDFNSDQLFDPSSPLVKSAALSAAAASENPPKEGLQVDDAAEAKKETNSGARAPIAIEVRQAFLQEETLHVKLGLEARVFVRADAVYVGLRGLADGVTMVEEIRSISEESNRRWLDPETRLLVSFSIPARGLSEYQVFGAWGDDAKKAALRLSKERVSRERLSKEKVSQERSESSESVAMQSREQDAAELLSDASKPARARLGKAPVGPGLPAENSTAVQDEDTGDRALALEDIEIDSQLDDCPAQPCDLRYRISARIRNESARAPIENLKLAVGLYWAEKGMLPQTPASGSAATANEEIISLRALSIAPGQSKAIRVNVNRGVPQIPGGQFVPHIRILPE